MFEVSVSARPGEVLVEAAGEIDMRTGGELRAALYAAVAAAGAGTVVLDLSAVRFLDSTGVQAMVDGYHQAMVAGGRLVVRGVRRGPARVLRLVGLARLFGIEQPPDLFGVWPAELRDPALGDPALGDPAVGGAADAGAGEPDQPR